MKILKRTQGIDLKAKNSHFHGSVTIQFRDPITNKVLDEEKHDNFFTKAIDDILNKCPWGLNNNMLMGRGIQLIANYDSSAANQKNGCICDIYKSLMGGVILFPGTLGDTDSDYFSDWSDNNPTAYATMGEYTVSDPKQGTYNGIESGELQNPNGFRYVYDWATSNGNGTIGAVALTHINAQNYFNNGDYMVFPRCSQFTDNNASGYWGQFNDVNSGYMNPMAMGDNGILICNNDASNNKKGNFYPIKPYNFHMLFTTRGYDVFDHEPAWSVDLSANAGHPSWQFYDGYLYALQKNSTGTNDTIITRINISTGAIVDTTTIRWVAPNMSNSSMHFAIKDGYVYAGSTVAGKIYKCKLGDANDVTELTCNAAINETLWTNPESDFIFGTNIVIKDGVIVNHSTPNLLVTTNCNTNGNRQILYNKGLWIVNAAKPMGNTVAAQFLTPYCATKNNLSETKTKTPDKTMKVIYTVTQV